MVIYVALWVTDVNARRSFSLWHVFGAVWELLVAAVLLAMGRKLALAGRRAYRSRVMPEGTLREQLEDGTYVLYLRAFSRDLDLQHTEPVRGLWAWLLRLFGQSTVEQDRTWEERIILPFRHLGRLICVGQPGEQMPPLGADRYYLPHNAWKSAVSEAIRRCRVVVMLASIGPDEEAEGTLWEYTEAVRLLPPEQLVLIVPKDRESYDRFRERAAKYAAERVRKLKVNLELLPLPERPAPADATSGRRARRNGGQPLVGALTFPDRQPEFTPLTNTGHTRTRRLMARLGPHKAVRETVWDLAGRLEDRLPGRAEVRWGFSKMPTAPLGCLAVVGASIEPVRSFLHLSHSSVPVFLLLTALLIFRDGAALMDKASDQVRVLPPELAVVQQKAFPEEEAKAADRAQSGTVGDSYFTTQVSSTAESTRIRAKRVMTDWFLCVGLLISVGLMLTPLVRGSAVWVLWLMVAVVAVASFAVVHGRIIVHARRPRSPKDILVEPSALFLRPDFTSGTVWSPAANQALREVFRGPYPYVVVGAAGEVPLRCDGWGGQLVVPEQDPRLVVSAALLKAGLVITVAAPGSENVWRFTEAVLLQHPEQVVLLVCAGSNRYRQFTTEVAAEFARRKSQFPNRGPETRKYPRLPRYPAHGQATKVFEPEDWTQLVAVVCFTRGWKPQIHRFDPPARFVGEGSAPARRRIRRELLPTLKNLKAKV